MFRIGVIVCASVFHGFAFTKKMKLFQLLGNSFSEEPKYYPQGGDVKKAVWSYIISYITGSMSQQLSKLLTKVHNF